MQKIFFELIQIALGLRRCLSHSPTVDEWGELYDMAKKQSLVGICFAGVQKLQLQRQEPSEKLYLIWMGMAAKIQQRNEIVNRQCVEIQAKFAVDGLRSCILKGQGNSALYGSSLCMLRQPGDIDIWVDSRRDDIIEHVQKVAPTTNVREHHLELQVFSDTEVEVHYWPAIIRHFKKNARLQKWFDERRKAQFEHRIEIGGQDLFVPTAQFNAIQQMSHMYHHLFDGGIGLRQVMDYYFVLQNLDVEKYKEELVSAFDYIGMKKFASAMMYVLQVTMGLEREKMICEPSEKDGRFLLEEILRGGNFGKFDNKQVRDSSHYFSSFYGGLIWNLRLLRFNTFDWFWSPLWRLYYFGWRKMHGYH